MLEAEGEKGKPGLSHFLDLYPKGRVPGHLLGTPQHSWSPREGRWERGGEEMDKREGERDEGRMEWRIKGGGVGMEGRRVGMEGRRKAGVREAWDGQRTLFCSPG